MTTARLGCYELPCALCSVLSASVGECNLGTLGLPTTGLRFCLPCFLLSGSAVTRASVRLCTTCACACASVCTCISVHVCVPLCPCLPMCPWACVYVCLCVCMHVCLCASKCMYAHVCVFVHVFACVGAVHDHVYLVHICAPTCVPLGFCGPVGLVCMYAHCAYMYVRYPVHVSLCACALCLCTCMHACLSVCMPLYLCACMHACVCMCTYISNCVCLCSCVHVCMHACVCMCTYIYNCARNVHTPECLCVCLCVHLFQCMYKVGTRMYVFKPGRDTPRGCFWSWGTAGPRQRHILSSPPHLRIWSGRRG